MEERRLSPVIRLLIFGVGAFLILPILIVVPISFSNAEYLQFPPRSWSLRWYRQYTGSYGWIEATVLSLKVAGSVTVLSSVLGTAAAFALVRSRFPGKTVALAVLLSPLIVPSIITAIAIYFMFAPLRLVGTTIGLVIAHTVVALPLVIIAVTTSLHGFDERIENAALSLGASRLYALRRVTLPLIAPGVFTGAALAFLTSFDEVVIAIFLAGTNATTLPKKMWDGLMLEITPAIAAAATIVIGITLVLFCLMAGIQAYAKRASRTGS